MKRISLFCFVLLLSSLCFLYGDDSFSFQSETARLRAQIALPSTAPLQKHELLSELAELLKLSGDNESAARAWRDAAYAVPGSRDERALLEEAVCLMAIGEWEAADSAVRLVLVANRAAPALMIQARYLSAQIEAFTRGNTEALSLLLEDPDYATLKASIYYTLFMITKDAAYRMRLVADFPDSPETRLVTNNAAFPGAMWFLYPGKENIVIER